MNTLSDSLPDRRVLASVEAGWSAAGSPWNADALTALYTDDAVFFGGRPGHASGRAAIHAYFRSYEGVILSGGLAFVDPVLMALGPDILLAQGYADFAFVLAGDEHTRSRLRATLVVVRRGGRWLIQQHHFSPTPAEPPLRNPGTDA